MVAPAHSTFTRWSGHGRQAFYVRTLKPPGGVLDLLEVSKAGDMSSLALSDIVPYRALAGGARVICDLGGGHCDLTSKKGDFCVAAPKFVTTAIMDDGHQLPGLAVAVQRCQSEHYEASDTRFSFDLSLIYGGLFVSPGIRSALRNLRARAAGCEILAERRCMTQMRARLLPFHFARMSRHSTCVPPRVCLTRLRVQKTRELLQPPDFPVTEIAHKAGYSSNQPLARVFLKHRRKSPTDYRRAVRDPRSPRPRGTQVMALSVPKALA